MIRVAMLAEHAGSHTRVDGGVQAVTRYLIDSLVQCKELDLHVLSFKYGVQDIVTRDEGKYQWHIIPAKGLDAFTAYRGDQKTVNEILDRIAPDIVHSQGAGHYGIVATRSRYPAVVTIHGIMSEEAKHAATLRLRFRRHLVSLLSDRYCIRGNKHTILISPYVEQYYGHHLVGDRSFIPNPVPPEFFSIERREKHDRILFAGRLLPLKGVRNLILSACELEKKRKLEIVLAGSLSNASYVKQLRSLVARQSIGKRVHFRGILSEEEMLGELAQCSVLVLPSYQETAPMVIQEAMAAGVPVIASRVGGVPHQVVHGKTGFIVEPGDISGLTNSLEAILSDPVMRTAFGAAAKQFAENNYRAEVVAERTIDVYRKIIASRRK